MIYCNYEARLALTDQKIDSSWERNDPFKFVLGVDQVIKCWEAVLPKVPLGYKVEFFCPAASAYGAAGVGELVPPESDIIFTL